MGKHLTDDPPSEEDPRYKIWEFEEALITNWMFKNMEEEQRDDYLLIDCVRDLWQEMKKSCAEMHSDFRVFDLRERADQIGKSIYFLISSKTQGHLERARSPLGH